MALKRRQFRRLLGKRQYKKLFIIAVEGNKTEVQYFNQLKNLTTIQPIIHIKCLKSNHRSSPPQVLKRMLSYLKTESLRKTDEAWLVVDKDEWTDDQLLQLYEWSLGAENYGFALSNPKFEYWLLLHFEDGVGITTSRQCSDRLEQYCPGYDKGIDFRKIVLKRIHDAIRRAINRNNPPCSDWPRNMCATTIYKLVLNILGLSENVVSLKTQITMELK